MSRELPSIRQVVNKKRLSAKLSWQNLSTLLTIGFLAREDDDIMPWIDLLKKAYCSIVAARFFYWLLCLVGLRQVWLGILPYRSGRQKRFP